MEHETVLITGGAGFIGSRLARRLSARNRVFVFDNLHPQVHGFSSNAAGRSTAADADTGSLIVADVTDADAVAKTVRYVKPSIVFHLASETGTGQSYDEPKRYCDANVIGTTNLVEAIRKYGKSVKRIVLASSRSVYGEGAFQDADGRAVQTSVPRHSERMAAGDFHVRDAQGVALRPTPTPETHLPSPASVYASTKLMQEYILQQCFEGTDVGVSILRFQNVYGPGQSLSNPYTGVISIFCEQILSGKVLDIYEDGDIVRDFVFVDDAVRALESAATCEVFPFPINIGSGEAVTILQMAQTLLRCLGADEDRVFISGKFRAGDVRYAVADIARARSCLGWAPTTSFAVGLQAVANWAREERSAARSPVR